MKQQQKNIATIDMNWIKRHKVITAIFVIFALFIVGSALNYTKDSSGSTAPKGTPAAKTATAPAPAATQPKIGQAANDGKFAFTVNSIQCNQATVGDQYLTKTAQGQYCLVNVTVKNIANEAQIFDAGSQYLYNAQSQKYTADSSASFYANPSGSTFLDSINPGNSVTGVVVFDLPKGVTPITAELHDSSFSGGVKVSLQ